MWLHILIERVEGASTFVLNFTLADIIMMCSNYPIPSSPLRFKTRFFLNSRVSRSREVVGRRSSAAGCCCVDHDLEIPAAEATIHNPQLTTDHHTTTRLLTAVLSSRNCSTEVTVLPTPHARTRLIVYGTGTLRGDTLLTRWYREL